MCKESGLTVAQLMMKNELTWRDEAEVTAAWIVSGRSCRTAWRAAAASIPRGRWRAARPAAGASPRPELYRNLTQRAERTLSDPLSVMDWVNLYAMAVNEENAAGGVVTAPTNGAAASSRPCCTITTASFPARTARACAPSC